MESRIVQIGNSRGIRLPKVLIDEAQLEDAVELEAEPGRIVIRRGSRPRAGGRQQLEKCASDMKTVSLIRQRPHGSRRKNESGDREHVAARGEVYLVQLDPTRGSEIRKTRHVLSSHRTS